MISKRLLELEEDSVDIPLVQDDYKRVQLLKLQHKIRRLKIELSKKMSQIRQCKINFEDANKVVEELNDTLKTKS